MDDVTAHMPASSYGIQTTGWYGSGFGVIAQRILRI